jgi:WD40 repeat protein
LWDAETGEIRAEPFRHPGVVVALAFTPDSRSLISGCRHQEALHVWNVATGQLVKKINAPGTDLLVLAVSPDGKQIAAGDRVMDLRILEMATGAEVRSLPSYKDPVERRTTEKIALAYSPDGRRLAFTGQDQAHVDVWDTQTNQQLARLTGHTGAVYAVAFSRDGKRLASAGNDRTIRLWDAATWECTAELKGHTDEVFALAFHPGGTRLASAGRDRMIWLWDLAKAQDVARLQGHTNYVFALDFSPDGKTLVSGSGDNTVRLWDTEPLAVRYEARRKAKR